MRQHVTDPLLDTALSFVTPFAAYVTAEETSTPPGVIAVVVAGLLLGHKAPILQTAQSRIAERINWRSIAFLLESTVFLLIGLQARWIIADVFDGDLRAGPDRRCLRRVAGRRDRAPAGLGVPRALPAGAARADRQTGERPPWTYTFMLGWAGMRGVVTLAAAFVIPQTAAPRRAAADRVHRHRRHAVHPGARRCPGWRGGCEVPSPDPGADALARANLLHQASQAGLAKLDELDEDDPHAVSELICASGSCAATTRAWERIGASEDETPSEIYTRRRKLMIDAERARVLEIRDTGTIAHEVVDEVLAMLDVEESMLDYADEERERVKRRPDPLPARGRLRPPAGAPTRRRRHPRRVRRLPARRHPRGCTCGCACLRPRRLLRLLARAARQPRTSTRPATR